MSAMRVNGDYANVGCGLGFGVHLGVALCYAVPAFVWSIVAKLCFGSVFSSLLTCVSAVQFAGFIVLVTRAWRKKTVDGLSSKTLVLFVIFLSFRLCATVFTAGYIPVGVASKVMDVCSLVFALHLLYTKSYQEESDKFLISPLLVACMVFGCLSQGMLVNLWSASLNLEAVILVPQLWMTANIGKVDGVAADFLAAGLLSRMISFVFWFGAHRDVVLDGQVVGLNLLIALVVQLLFGADFTVNYLEAWTSAERRSEPVPQSRLDDDLSDDETDYASTCSESTSACSIDSPRSVQWECPQKPAVQMREPRRPCSTPGGLPARPRSCSVIAPANPFVTLFGMELDHVDQKKPVVKMRAPKSPCSTPGGMPSRSRHDVSKQSGPFVTLFSMDLDNVEGD